MSSFSRPPSETSAALTQTAGRTPSDRLAVVEATLEALKSSALGRVPSLAEAEALAESLPALLGTDFELFLGVPSLRELVARYLDEQHEMCGADMISSSPCAESEHVARTVKSLTGTSTWRDVVAQCRTAMEAQRRRLMLLHQQQQQQHREGHRRCADGDGADVLVFDGDEGSLFHELDGALASSFGDVLDESYFARGGAGAGYSRDSSCLEDEQHRDPNSRLALHIRAFAQKCEGRVGDPYASFSCVLSTADPSQEASGRGVVPSEAGGTREAASAFLLFMTDMMDTHPEVVWQCSDWSVLVRLMTVCLEECPEEGLSLAERYFAGAGPRQRLLLLNQLIALVDKKMEPGFLTHLVMTVRRFMEELPTDWVTLLDRELGAVLTAFLATVAVPHAVLLSSCDPCASWLARWSERPSLTPMLCGLPDAAPTLLGRLADRMWPPAAAGAAAEPCSHAMCVVAMVLPFLGARPEVAAAANESTPPTAGTAELLATQLLHCALRDDFPRKWYGSVGVRVSGALRLVSRKMPIPVWLEGLRACTSSLQRLVDQWQSDTHRSRASVERISWILKVIESVLFDRAVPALEGDAQLRGSLCEQLTALYAMTSQLRCARTPSQHTEHITRCSLALWRMVLPGYGLLCEQIITTSILDAVDQGDQYAIELLVCCTTHLALWLRIRPHLTRPGGRRIHDFGAVLDAMLLPELDCSSSSSGESSKHACGPAVSTRACVLLQRWSTVPYMRAGLRRAAAARLAANAHPLFYESARVGDWPLLLPVELIAGDRVDGEPSGRAPVPMELPPAAQQELSHAALYQLVGLLLGVAHAPLRGVGTSTDEGDEEPFVAAVLRQIEHQFLVPAAADAVDCDSGTPAAIAETAAGFGDDSLLVLLCVAAVSVLTSVEAEGWLWRCSSSTCDAEHRQGQLRALRTLCAARRGVDPVYFLVRFLTSGGKGKKRLEPILLRGFAADLRVETVIDVGAFVDGEDYPRPARTPRCLPDAHANPAARPSANEEATIQELLMTAFGNEAAVRYTKMMESSTAAALRETISLVRESYNSADLAEIARVLQRRSLEEWLTFADTASCAEAVTQRILASAVRLEGLMLADVLAECGVDLHFLSCVCVSSWLRAPPLEACDAAGTGSNGNGEVLRASLKGFVKRGLDAWLDLVASSLSAFIVSTLQRQDEAVPNTAAVAQLPVSSLALFPSSAFVSLIVRTFTLGKGKTRER